MAGTGIENCYTFKNVRGSFLHVFEPRKNDDGTQGGYEATGIISPDDPQIKEFEKLIDAVAKEKWKDKAPAMLKTLRATDKTCVHNGDNKATLDGYAGNYYVKANAQTKPLVIDRDKTELTKVDGKPYSGCYVDMKVQVWAQDNKYGKRVNASLRYVQFRKDGDAFSSAPPATADEAPDISDEDEQAVEM